MTNEQLRELAEAANLSIKQRANMNEAAFSVAENKRREFRDIAPAAILALLDRIKELEDELRACVGSLDYVERTYPLHAGYGVRQHRIETARTLLEKSK